MQQSSRGVRRSRRTLWVRLRSGLRSPQGRKVIVISALAFVLAGSYWWYVSTIPYRLANKMIAAMERRDAATIYELSTPEDRKLASLSPASIARTLNDVFD